MTSLFMTPNPQGYMTNHGIGQVIKAMATHLPRYGFTFTDDYEHADLAITHAGEGFANRTPDITICHGLYPTGVPHYAKRNKQWQRNRTGINHDVIYNLVVAKHVIAPSQWVGEILRRDMHLDPHIVQWGVNIAEWSTTEPVGGYALWNKNRSDDVCDPQPFIDALHLVPHIQGFSTFGKARHPANLQVIGRQSHVEMRHLIQRAGVYVSTTPETGDIGSREALACGVPVVALAQGAITEFLEHGVTGYLANSVSELAYGMEWCLKHRDELRENILLRRDGLDWSHSIRQMAEVLTVTPKNPVRLSVIIPNYNYAEYVAQAILSVGMQQPSFTFEVLVVDDGSVDSSRAVIADALNAVVGNPQIARAQLLTQDNAGVSVARNHGIDAAMGEYILCLDADDALADGGLEVLVKAMERNPQLGIAYSAMQIMGNGQAPHFPPPDEIRYARQYEGINQIPTCAIFRRADALRVGGYRSWGKLAGEDADFFLRLILHTGKRAYRVTPHPYFQHRQHDSHFWGSHDGYRARGASPLITRELIGTPQPVTVSNVPNVQYTNPVKHYHEPLLCVYIEGVNGIMATLDNLEGQPFYRWVTVSDSLDRPVFAPFLRELSLSEARELAPWLIRVGAGTTFDNLASLLQAGCEAWSDEKRGVVMCCGNKTVVSDSTWTTERIESEFVEAVYTGVTMPNTKVAEGKQTVFSLYAKQQGLKLPTGRQDYGRRSPNDIFLVHRGDIELEPYKYIAVPQPQGDDVPYSTVTPYERLD